MANSDKNIVITPAVGNSTADPKIVFSGANANLTAQNITLSVYPDSNGTLSFDGSAGQLFSVTNSLTGSIFSVNDVSGIPSIEVIDSGLVKLAQYSGNVVIGSATDDGINKLQVNGTLIGTVLKSNITTGTAPLVVTSTTLVANLNVARANVADFEVITTASTGNYYLGMVDAITGNVAQVGNAAILANVTSGTLYATKFSGDGGLLSNITAAAGSYIANGTSNIAIASSGANATFQIAGNANIMQVTGTGVVVSNDTGYGVNKLRNLKIMSTVPVAGDFLGNGDIIFVYVP